MSAPLYISRLRLKRGDSAVLRSGPYGVHQAVATAVKGSAPWRLDDGECLVVAANPATETEIFDVLGTKLYMPRLQSGEILRFDLRACATVSRSRRHHDLVVDAMQRADASDARSAGEVAEAVYPEWLARRGLDHGFEPVTVMVGRRVRNVGLKQGIPIPFWTVDLSGTLRITNPVAFLDALYSGIGRARSLGAGLLLAART